MPQTQNATSERGKKKHNCGHCKEDMKGLAGTSIVCGFCETFFHLIFVDGMNKMFGGSAFLCVICRKLATKLNKSFQEVEIMMKGIEAKLRAAKLERDALKKKVGRMEDKTDQVKDKVIDMEKDIEAGMEKVKTEMTQDMTKEMKDRKEISNNIVIYGLKEAEGASEDWKKDDEEKVKEMIKEIGVEVQGVVEVQFHAGRKRNENGKPRPTIVKIEDGETREKVLDNAQQLARKDGWADVFVAPDMTPKQREQSRKDEDELREKATKQTEEAKNEGRKGKFVVVGRRGRRRLMWWEERV